MLTVLGLKTLVPAGIGIRAGIASAAQSQYFMVISLPMLIAIIVAVILGLSAIFAFFKRDKIAKWLQDLSTKFVIPKINKQKAYDKFDKYIQMAGYEYDPVQDIFYSTKDAWQRKMGYCRLYDEAMAPSSMIVDAEPVYFAYNGRRWLIELWKGQYGMTTGCEIGIYSTKGMGLNIPGIYKGYFYNCVSDEDMLFMSVTLKKNGKTLFKRQGIHWWMTGFKLGEFSQPWELIMEAKITLKDAEMRDAFIKGLKETGYTDNDIFVSGNTVGLVYDKPHSRQPITRTELTDSLTQKKNKLLCDKFMEVTGAYDNLADKLYAIQKYAPELYKPLMNIGKTKAVFESYEKIKDYLNE